MDEGKTMNFIRKTSLVAGVIAISACATDETPVYIAAAPTPSPMQLCEVTSLAQERKSAIETIQGANVKGMQNGQSFLSRKLQDYQARMEIAYRGMVSSCNLYANCLDRNSGREEQCVRSENNYSEARGQFYAMISESDRIKANIEIARQRAIAAAANAAAEKRRLDRLRQEKENSKQQNSSQVGDCSPSCSTTANIFTDSCCPVDDEDE